MKLYVKATSERASDGQGGNEYVHIDLFGENEVMLTRFVFRKHPEFPDKYVLVEDYFFRSGQLSVQCLSDLSGMVVEGMRQKGKKQKGEIDCGCEKGVFCCYYHYKHRNK